MKQCQDCSSVMEDGYRYCPQCAAPTDSGALQVAGVKARYNAHYCGKCGAKLPGGRKFCLICGTGAGQEPPPAESGPEPDEEQKKQKPRRKTRLLARTVALLSLLLAATAVGAWAWQSLPYVLHTDRMRADNAILYVQNGDTLRIKSSNSTEARTLAENFSIGVMVPEEDIAQYSHTGRYLAYLDSTVVRELNSYHQAAGSCMGDLYLLDLGKATRGDTLPDEGVLLARRVTNLFAFSQSDNALVYLTADGDLFAYDHSESRLLESGVDSLVDVGERQALFTREGQLLLKSLDGGQTVPAGTLDSPESLLDWTDDFSRLLYTAPGEAPESRNIILSRPGAGVLETLATNAHQVVDASADAGAVLYTRQVDYLLDYEDFVDDDLARLDEQMPEPDISLYPELEDYYNTYGEFPEEWEVIDGLEEEQEDLVQLIEEYHYYRGDEREYNEMLERKRLRESISAELERLSQRTFPRYELLYSGENGERVVTDQAVAGAVTGDARTGYAVYCTQDFSALEPVKMSRLYRLERFSLSALLQESVRQTIWLHSPEGQSYTMWGTEPGEVFAEPFALSWQDAVYFQVRRSQQQPGRLATGTLFYCPVQEGTPFAAVVARDVQYCFGALAFQDQVLYAKDYREGSGSLYALSGRESQLLSYDMSLNGLQVAGGGKSLLYYESFDPRAGSGDLWLTAQQKRHIATDVSSYYYRGDNLIYLMKNLREGKGDLYAYGNGVLALVDSGVTHILPMEEAPQD